ISDVLVNFSYRSSNREDTSDLFAANTAPTTGTGAEVDLRIATLEGSWVPNSRSYLTFKYSHFANENLSKPDFASAGVPSTDIGSTIDINNLDQMGLFTVPLPVAGSTAYNNFIQPY